MSIEAMKQALEALETLMIERGSVYEKAITALKERLAQPEPIQSLQCFHCQVTIETLNDKVMHLLAERTEQNFCSRCGKRTKDIHTCTPPKENT